MSDDPFFKQIREGDWNACIGVQADAQDYMDGFVEAARVPKTNFLKGLAQGLNRVGRPSLGALVRALR